MMNRFRIQDSRFRNGILILILTFCFLLPTSINAQSVDILWQGETYVPPFYKGRNLWSSQSGIRFVAISQGLGNAANLNYKWTKNGTVLGNISGVGKNTLSFSDSILSKPQTIKVDIMSNQDKVLATASTFVTPISPTLAVYENNPLYGFMFHREVSGTHKLKEREVTFAAFPFFFDIVNRQDGVVSYEWHTNVGNVETGNMVTYRTPDNTSGSSEVQVRISNTEKILQDANKSFLVEFEN